MSLGKKVILLLVLLLILIVYTLVNFDYSKYKASDHSSVQIQENIQNSPISDIGDTFTEIKTTIFKTIDEYFNPQQEVIKKEEPKIEKQVINEPKEENKKEIDKKKSEEKSDENSTKEEVKPKEEAKKVEKKKIEKPKIVSTRQIQKEIDKILKDQKITFQRRSVKITNASFSSVKKVAQILKKYEKLEIEIAGHTDSRGAASLNKRISQDRANSVKNVLINLGVKNKLKAVGYGEKYPIAKDDANGLSKENRRVEINITGDNR